MTCYHTACAIVKKLQENGFIAYFAGGWVRDFLMDHPSDDIDIATSATTTDMMRLFTKTIPVGIQFGILIVVENDHHFELATFRKDEGYEDGRRPTAVSQANAEEDASRRDFTINGMFYDPITQELIDFVKGQEDLKNKIVKAIGNPHERFLEDRLRMIRAARYACRFGFTIEEETKKAIILHSNALFPSVAIERVWQEFNKIDRAGKLKSFLVKLHKLELLQTIFQDLEHLSHEELVLRISPLDHYTNNAPLIIKVLELFPHYTLDKKLELCEKLKLSSQDKDLVRYYDKFKTAFDMALLNLSSFDLYTWAQLYAHPQAKITLEMLSAHHPQEMRDKLLQAHLNAIESLSEAVMRIQNKNPVVTSFHLMKEDVKPGKSMGLLLKEAEKISINENSMDPHYIITRLKTSPLWPL